jgi:hypothetical protein
MSGLESHLRREAAKARVDQRLLSGEELVRRVKAENRRRGEEMPISRTGCSQLGRQQDADGESAGRVVTE